jgi:hypothetical protein
MKKWRDSSSTTRVRGFHRASLNNKSKEKSIDANKPVFFVTVLIKDVKLCNTSNRNFFEEMLKVKGTNLMILN